MTKDEMIQFVNEYYPVPIQKHWNPSEYEMKYRYNTPRKLKKLEKDREKNDTKLYSQYVAKVNCRDEVIHIVNDIDLLPERLKDLFYLTLKNQVLNDIKTRETFYEYLKIFKSEYDKVDSSSTIKSTPYGWAYEMVKYYKQHWDETQQKYIRSFDDRQLQYFRNQISGFDSLDIPKFIEAAEKYLQLKKYADATLSPQEDLECGSKKIKEIIVLIRKTLGGDPDSCEYDANWGVGNEFNGIVYRGETKASFKSFLAGGWNIQRLHVRFRITLLK